MKTEIPEWKVALLQKKKEKKSQHQKMLNTSNLNKVLREPSQFFSTPNLSNQNIKYSNGSNDKILQDLFNSNNALNYNQNMNISHYNSTNSTSNLRYKDNDDTFSNSSTDSISTCPSIENIPPIKQNPILASDLQDRYKRYSLNLDSKLPNPIFEQLRKNMEEEEEGVRDKSRESVNKIITYANIDEENELKYGKGFVEKLLKRFNELYDIRKNSFNSKFNTLDGNTRWGSMRRLGEILTKPKRSESLKIIGHEKSCQRKLTEEVTSFKCATNIPTVGGVRSIKNKSNNKSKEANSQINVKHVNNNNHITYNKHDSSAYHGTITIHSTCYTTNSNNKSHNKRDLANNNHTNSHVKFKKVHNEKIENNNKFLHTNHNINKVNNNNKLLVLKNPNNISDRLDSYGIKSFEDRKILSTKNQTRSTSNICANSNIKGKSNVNVNNVSPAEELPRTNQVKLTKSIFESTDSINQSFINYPTSEMKSIFGKSKKKEKVAKNAKLKDSENKESKNKNDKKLNSQDLKLNGNSSEINRSNKISDDSQISTNIDEVQNSTGNKNAATGDSNEPNINSTITQQPLLPDLLTSSIPTKTTTVNPSKQNLIINHSIQYYNNKSNVDVVSESIENNLDKFFENVSTNVTEDITEKNSDKNYINNLTLTSINATTNNIGKTNQTVEVMKLNREFHKESNDENSRSVTKNKKPGKLVLKQSSNITKFPLQPYLDIKNDEKNKNKYRESGDDEDDEIVSSVDDELDRVPVTNLDVVLKNKISVNKKKEHRLTNSNSTYYRSIKKETKIENKNQEDKNIFLNNIKNKDANNKPEIPFSVKSRSHSPPPKFFKSGTPEQKADSIHVSKEEKLEEKSSTVVIGGGVILGKSILRNKNSRNKNNRVKFKRDDSLIEVFEYPPDPDQQHPTNQTYLGDDGDGDDGSDDDEYDFASGKTVRDSLPSSDNLSFYKTKLNLEFDFESLGNNDNNYNNSNTKKNTNSNINHINYVSEICNNDVTTSNPFSQSSLLVDLLF